MWKDKLFWFAQPSSALLSYDNYFLWIFAGLTILGVVIRFLVKLLARHPIVSKLWSKFSNASLTMGLIGILWYGLRYENTPFLADRYWAALVVIIFVIWLGYIIKYLFRQFRAEKNSYDRMQLNSKYIPGPRR